MNEQKVIYEVGKIYKVPCIKTHWPKLDWTASEWLPILLPAHEDADLAENIGLHYHFDLRFIKKVPEARDFGFIENGLSEWKQEIQYRNRKCYRADAGNSYPHYVVIPTWFPKLQAQYKCAKLKNNICPHRGIDLTGCGGRTVVCPGHGLVWDRETGSQIKIPTGKV